MEEDMSVRLSIITFFYLIYLSYFLPAGGGQQARGANRRRGPAGVGPARVGKDRGQHRQRSEGRCFFFFFVLFGSSLLFLRVAGVA
jgi:hypothetical protein